MSETAAPPPPLIALDAALAPLRQTTWPPVHSPAPLFAAGDDGQASPAMGLAPGVMLHADPAAVITGHWSSPAGRLAEITAAIATPGAWFALHVSIPLPDLTGLGWIALILRSSAARTALIRPCLRSGRTDGGFHDHFFPRHVLSQSRESDHHDLIALPWHPDLPQSAPWREIILFLPPAEGFRLVIHDLRILAL
jgi:hypothetical protein